jgi:acetyl-CoA C-acetyltransferase
MQRAVIVSAARTPVGAFLGGLAPLSAPQLGAIAVREAVARARLEPGQVEEVILGNVLQAGVGQNPARQAALGAGLPETVAAFTVNKVCGSGLKCVMLAAQAIRTGDAQVIVAGGMESMSNAPYLLARARTGLRLGHAELLDANLRDGLWCTLTDQHMGSTAELVARDYHVSRQEMDAYAVESHRRAVAAAESGAFDEEIVPVEVPQRKGDPVVVRRDEGPRKDTSLEALARLRPAFDQNGAVTAGNASMINDGAAAVVVMSESKARELGLEPLAAIEAYATAGLAPEWVMMTPVPATRLVLEKAGWTSDQVELVELNEAFAVQACAVTDQLALDRSKVNVHGGAVALGHPIGASGARVLVTLLHAMKRRGARKGLATLCLGGGNGVAMAVTR